MGRPGDERRIERLTEALERTLRRLARVDPDWDRYTKGYPANSAREMIELHEASQEHRSARRALEARRCRRCKLTPKDVPQPRNFTFVEHDLCTDCAVDEAGAYVAGPGPDDPRGHATDHRGRP